MESRNQIDQLGDPAGRVDRVPDHMNRSAELIMAAADRVIWYHEAPDKALAHVIVQDTMRRLLDEYLHAHFCLCA